MVDYSSETGQVGEKEMIISRGEKFYKKRDSVRRMHSLVEQ